MEMVAEPGDITAHYHKLNETVACLRSLLAQDAASTVAAWDRRIVPLVDEFDLVFRLYLAEKDRGGFMRRVIEQRPTKAPIVWRLRRQADGIAEELADIRAQRQSGRTGLEEMASTAGRLRNLLEEVRVHQEEANGLVQHVSCQDIGFPA